MPTQTVPPHSGPGQAEGLPDEIAAMSFEAALAELERIVRGLEGGQQKLDDAIGAYERGAALRRHCEARLAEAETRMQAIVVAADGSVSARDAGETTGHGGQGQGGQGQGGQGPFGQLHPVGR